jgi:hypothetical protein
MKQQSMLRADLLDAKRMLPLATVAHDLENGTLVPNSRLIFYVPEVIQPRRQRGFWT